MSCSRFLGATLFAFVPAWLALAGHWVKYECVDKNNGMFETGQLTDDGKDGQAPGPCAVSGPDSAYCLQTVTLQASGGYDCDNLQWRPPSLLVPKGCTRTSGTVDNTTTCDTATHIGITRHTNDDELFQWTTNNTDFHFVPLPLDSYTGWKNARTTWAIYLGLSNATVSVHVDRAECGDSIEEPCPQSNSIAIDCTGVVVFTAHPLSAGKTVSSTANVGGVFEAASLIVNKDQDGPSHRYDHDCDDEIDAQSPLRGQYDYSLSKKYVLDGPLVAYTGTEKDTVYSPPRPDHPEDAWYQSVTEDVVFCVTVMSDYDQDGKYQSVEAVSGSPIKMSQVAGADTFVHEFGHCNGLRHIDRTTTDVNFEGNVMVYIDVSAGWISSVAVPIEDGVPPVPAGQESQVGKF
ncbi:MAG: hypothetical protein GY851_03670 [bacterium]|nr:hypothetical protein [bacterium]